MNADVTRRNTAIEELRKNVTKDYEIKRLIEALLSEVDDWLRKHP